MKPLIRLFGWPHELLHVLALRLIGRRAVQAAQTHVDIPDDLSTAEYIFVAGLPALVFWGGTALCARALFGAADIFQAALWFALASLLALAGIGTTGDMLLIIARVTESWTKPPPDE